MQTQSAAILARAVVKSAGSICVLGSITPWVTNFELFSPSSKCNRSTGEFSIWLLSKKNQQSLSDPVPPFLLGIRWFGIAEMTGNTDMPAPACPTGAGQILVPGVGLAGKTSSALTAKRRALGAHKLVGENGKTPGNVSAAPWILTAENVVSAPLKEGVIIL